MWDAYFWVDEVEQIYHDVLGRGALHDYGLCVQPWGVKEFGIQDLDGHDIAFGQNVGTAAPVSPGDAG
jgi:hypothetical protein